MHRLLRLWLRHGAAWILCGLAQGALAQAATAPPPIEHFFRRPVLERPVLSPDGSQLAAVLNLAGKRGQLAVIDMRDPSRSKILASVKDADIYNIAWVNARRLVFDVTDGQSDALRGFSPGLWAVDVDGQDFRQLISSQPPWTTASAATRVIDRMLPWSWELHSVQEDGSDEVLIQEILTRVDWSVRRAVLARLDTRSGRRRSAVEQPPTDAVGWLTDRKGRPVAVITSSEDRYALRSALPGQDWKLIHEGKLFIDTQGYELLGAGDRGELWVIGPDPEGPGDAAVLMQLDMQTPQAKPKVLLALQGYDFDGRLVRDAKTGRLIGAHFETDGRGTVWFDPALRALQAEVDAVLPQTINRLNCRACLSDELILVSAGSDRQPMVYYRYERAGKQLTPLFESRPWIDPSRMGRREMATFKARDGLAIPVLVTHPAGPPQAKRPAVMLVHGGPWVRGAHWDWESDAQFLASRGYVVIEPEFRGSTGYGLKHFKAGWKQWGQAMQDDVADALDWAVAQGWVDPKRVCIAGASYGGYATLMGLIRHPDKYRCGVNWVGVTDIDLLYSINWSDFSDRWKAYGMPAMVGDREKDAEMLKANSPLLQAHKIKQPLLLAYGGEDYRVPDKHGTAFRDAVSEHNPKVEWVLYPQEGHGWLNPATLDDFWGRVERLLAREIGMPR